MLPVELFVDLGAPRQVILACRRYGGRADLAEHRRAPYCRPASTMPVHIPTTFGLDRGVWFHIREGIRGILVPDERGAAVAYVVIEPASNYYG